MTVNNDLYERWIEALESGKYPKTQGMLRNDDGYCCLGVVCDVADPNLWQQHAGFYYYKPPTIYDDVIYRIDLPDHIQLALTLYSASATFMMSELSPDLREEVLAVADTDNGLNSLVTINDATENFDLIIKVLKERPPSLFNINLPSSLTTL